MSLEKIGQLLSDTPKWLSLFNRDYQIKTVLRMNDILRDKGLTQKDIVEKTGWSKGYVSRLLSGRGNLTLKTVAMFESAVEARVLRVVEESPEATWTAVPMIEVVKSSFVPPVLSDDDKAQAVFCMNSNSVGEFNYG